MKKPDPPLTGVLGSASLFILTDPWLGSTRQLKNALNIKSREQSQQIENGTGRK